MKLRWILVFAAGIALMGLAAGLGVGLLAAGREPWVVFTAFMSAMLLILGPALACLMLANVTFDLEDPGGRGFLRRLVCVVVGIQLLGALGLVAVAVGAPETVGYLVGVLVLSGGLLWAGVRLGRRFQRRLTAEPVERSAWSPWPRSRVRRAIVRIAIVFALASLVGGGVVIGIGIALDEGDGMALWSPVIYGLSIGCMAASMACLVVAWPLVQEMRRVLDRDHATQKAIVRVVLRNKNDPLSEDAQDQAVAYAGIMAVYYPFQIAQLSLLFGGLWLQQVWNRPDDPSDPLYPLGLGMMIGIPVLLLVTLPFLIREARRARRYARGHAEQSPRPSGERR